MSWGSEGLNGAAVSLSLRPRFFSSLNLFSSFSHLVTMTKLKAGDLKKSTFITELSGETTGQKRKLECSAPFSIC